jgi:hypothetical protein
MTGHSLFWGENTRALLPKPCLSFAFPHFHLPAQVCDASCDGRDTSRLAVEMRVSQLE